MSEQCEHIFKKSAPNGIDICEKCDKTPSEAEEERFAVIESQLAAERQRAEALTAQLAAAVELLKDIYVDEVNDEDGRDISHDWHLCPTCEFSANSGHEEGCRIVAILANPPAAATALLKRLEQLERELDDAHREQAFRAPYQPAERSEP